MSNNQKERIVLYGLLAAGVLGEVIVAGSRLNGSAVYMIKIAAPAFLFGAIVLATVLRAYLVLRCIIGGLLVAISAFYSLFDPTSWVVLLALALTAVVFLLQARNSSGRTSTPGAPD